MKTGFSLCGKLYRENPVLALYRIAVLQNNLEIFDQNSVAKSLVQKGQGVESALPHAN